MKKAQSTPVPCASVLCLRDSRPKERLHRRRKGKSAGCRIRGQIVCGENGKGSFRSVEKAKTAFSFHFFAANYPRFRPFAYVSIARGEERAFCHPSQQPGQRVKFFDTPGNSLSFPEPRPCPILLPESFCSSPSAPLKLRALPGPSSETLFGFCPCIRYRENGGFVKRKCAQIGEMFLLC